MSSHLHSVLREQVLEAAAQGRTLRPHGSGSKDFLAQTLSGTPLDMRGAQGVIAYEPSELFITAHAGTRLAEVEALLAAHNQMLAFEPPHFGPHATLGGALAAGLSGPRRISAGSLRDFVLGVTLMDGQGRVLRFGGQVMKNVAGYDVARVLAGSLGILGVICEVSLKVLPRPTATQTLRFEFDEGAALQRVNEWGGQPLPVAASAWFDGTLVVRLAGAAAAVRAARERLGGEAIDTALAATFWDGLRDQTDEYFAAAAADVASGASLWRLSVPSTAAPLGLAGATLFEWGGAQRWLCSRVPAQQVRDAAARAGGHAVLFRAQDKSAGVFAPLSPPLARIHRALKQAFDPDGIFNPGRLYPDL